MLKLIPPLIAPDLLFALASLGHGDELALVDANFPADRLAAQGGGRLVRLSGVDTAAALQAVLVLLPLDDFEPCCAWSMQVVGQPQTVPAPVAQFRELLAQQGRSVDSLERHAFYERARAARLLVQTGDLRKYANVLLRKGVVAID
jgi:L-fucose mutarotase